MMKFAVIVALFLVLQYLAGTWRGHRAVYAVAFLEIAILLVPYLFDNPTLSDLLQMETPQLNMAANLLVMVVAIGLGLAFKRKRDESGGQKQR